MLAPGRAVGQPSLPEVHRSVPVAGAGFWRRLLAFTGPGYLVAVGYMDPGNWATDIAGGSAFGYQLLSVVLLANLMAVVLQALSARLGIASGLDLAQACRASYPALINVPLWLLCEVAICACDLAEVLGTAIALQLLFGLPLLAGVCLTVLDALLVLLLQRRGFRPLEALIGGLLLTVGICIGTEWALARPDAGAVLAGFVPRPALVTDPAMLYLAIGILGATVMPHNLYLHSAVVQTRRFERSPAGRRDAVRFAVIDSTVALTLALAVNAAILVVAAATFHVQGLTEVADISQAHRLLAPMLGAPLAGLLFALALLASGQNSTVTATLAGQVVMEGFVAIRLPAWLRRLVTRLIAIVPAVVVIASAGEPGVGRLLVLSQVVLSLQLPFAVLPLVHLTSRRRVMGPLVNPRWLQLLAGAIALLLVALNLKLGLDAVG